jgi:CBS domain-containing protein
LREELTHKLIDALEDLGETPVEEIIKKYPDIVPVHEVIGEAVRVGELLKEALNGIKYFVIMSRKGEIVGLVSDHDLATLLLSGYVRDVSVLPPLVTIHLRRTRVPPSILADMAIEAIMKRHPQIHSKEEPLKEVVSTMGRTETKAAIIVEEGEENKVLAVIDEYFIAELLRFVANEIEEKEAPTP